MKKQLSPMQRREQHANARRFEQYLCEVRQLSEWSITSDATIEVVKEYFRCNRTVLSCALQFGIPLS